MDAQSGTGMIKFAYNVEHIGIFLKENVNQYLNIVKHGAIKMDYAYHAIKDIP